MLLKVKPSAAQGSVIIPGSKSHTMRALYLATLAEGKSKIRSPLKSADSESAVKVCRSLGATIDEQDNQFIVHGTGGKLTAVNREIDVGNSGTSLRFGVAAAALGNDEFTFTGDRQIQNRPMGPLMNALYSLGAHVHAINHNWMAPLNVRGPIKGGEVELSAVTSQFLSALLLACPLCERDTTINVTRLNEMPYVEITLWWLDKMQIKYSKKGKFKSFHIPGKQRYSSFSQTIPGDFSSATFFMVLAAISGQEFFLQNLDMTDVQGDRKLLEHLQRMGLLVLPQEDGVKIKGRNLKGMEIDMNSTPDALPAMAVAGCFAEGETTLFNVPQARLKETDRISVMCKELSKMGADIKEFADALVIRKKTLHGASLSGHNDHRVTMALTIAGMAAEGESIVDTAESIKVTFPEFVDVLKDCGADLTYVS